MKINICFYSITDDTLDVYRYKSQTKVSTKYSFNSLTTTKLFKQRQRFELLIAHREKKGFDVNRKGPKIDNV